MELQELQDLTKNFDALQKRIVQEKSTPEIETFINQYNVEGHEINDTSKRMDKLITETDDQGNVTKNVAIPVARLSIPLQKKIVSLAAAFLVGNPITLQAGSDDPLEKDMIEVIKRTWENNKLDYESKRLAKLMMSETEVAELWYVEKAAPGYWTGTANENNKAVVASLRMKILSNSYGDTLYPVFDSAGDMIAFGRAYSIQVDQQAIQHFDIYTDTVTFKGTLNVNTWEVKEEKNIIGKIPVIYYAQEAPEWNDVQSMIDRLEVLISNHADTNDYFGSPSYFVAGKIVGFSKKGEQGKVIEGENGADVKILSWDQSPESVKLEYENLRSLIFDMTDTPDISIEQVKSLGLGQISGIALKMLFLSAHLKAADKEETFGKSMQRRINFLKTAMGVINLALAPAVATVIKPKFTYYLPKNTLEDIEILSTAVGAKPIMSVQTAVEQNPLVQDPEQEQERMQADQTESLIIPGGNGLPVPAN